MQHYSHRLYNEKTFQKFLRRTQSAMDGMTVTIHLKLVKINVLIVIFNVS